MILKNYIYPEGIELKNEYQEISLPCTVRKMTKEEMEKYGEPVKKMKNK